MDKKHKVDTVDRIAGRPNPSSNVTPSQTKGLIVDGRVEKMGSASEDHPRTCREGWTVTPIWHKSWKGQRKGKLRALTNLGVTVLTLTKWDDPPSTHLFQNQKKTPQKIWKKLQGLGTEHLVGDLDLGRVNLDMWFLGKLAVVGHDLDVGPG